MPAKKEKQYINDNTHLMAEWNWGKNNELELFPDKLTYGSNKKVWWRCSQGHEWQASISDRNKGNGCPYCSNRRVFKGENDLQTVNPALAKEWNYEKNNGLTPMDVKPNSVKKVFTFNNALTRTIRTSTPLISAVYHCLPLVSLAAFPPYFLIAVRLYIHRC